MMMMLRLRFISTQVESEGPLSGHSRRLHSHGFGKLDIAWRNLLEKFSPPRKGIPQVRKYDRVDLPIRRYGNNGAAKHLKYTMLR